MATSTIWAKQTNNSLNHGGRASEMFSFSNLKQTKPPKELALYLCGDLIIWFSMYKMVLLPDYSLKIVNKENMHSLFYYCASIFNESKLIWYTRANAHTHTHTKNMGLNVCIGSKKDLDKTAQIENGGCITMKNEIHTAFWSYLSFMMRLLIKTYRVPIYTMTEV